MLKANKQSNREIDLKHKKWSKQAYDMKETKK